MPKGDVLPKVGFIGLGAMGIPMTRRLVDAGYHVVGYDVSEEARRRASDSGVDPVECAEAAARDVDVVILMLPDSNVVESVLCNAEFLDAVVDGEIVVDMSSSEPQRTRALAGRLHDRGVTMIDAPVSGGVRGAQSGTLTVMVGGASDAVEDLRPLLENMGTVVHVGEVGSGHAVKALNNLLSASHLLITSEVMLAGERFGLDPKVMLGVFNSSSGRSGSTENKWPNFILTEDFNSGFGLRLMLKDMMIAVGLADQVGAGCELGADAVELWSRAAEELAPSADHTEIARWLREHNEGHEG